MNTTPPNRRLRAKVPPGDLSHRNRWFVSLFDWKVYKLKDLPPRAIKALGESRDPCLNKEELLDKYGPSFRFGMATVPMVALMVHCMNDCDRAGDFDTFEEYHREYAQDEKIPQHKSVWPIVLSNKEWGDDEDETIMDGWHRFHCYYRAGIKNVPVLWYVDR